MAATAAADGPARQYSRSRPTKRNLDLPIAKRSPRPFRPKSSDPRDGSLTELADSPIPPRARRADPHRPARPRREVHSQRQRAPAMTLELATTSCTAADAQDQRAEIARHVMISPIREGRCTSRGADRVQTRSRANSGAPVLAAAAAKAAGRHLRQQDLDPRPVARTCAAPGVLTAVDSRLRARRRAAALADHRSAAGSARRRPVGGNRQALGRRGPWSQGSAGSEHAVLVPGGRRLSLFHRSSSRREREAAAGVAVLALRGAARGPLPSLPRSS